ncbi:glycosyltransferase involved in cell wall biosynthesis [Rhodococcus sp. SMB37]|uniref:glycosyltransferase n=1 Tax=Rhodococcus sp. SMB37 TaxID=2512213 RepID=UPI0010537EA5|nr:glycosyltransferase [Rhodococcus sp. SMB37]TCN49163.1 glycosyltransferase involved in cell wall biosynthesis [Rhodococcus sp. SMB37]
MKQSVINIYPMHGYYKSLLTGFRTRDGHIMEWLASEGANGCENVDVYSRAEPVGYRRWKLRGTTDKPLANTRDLTPDVLWPPNPRDPKNWWVTSARFYKSPQHDGPSIVWNPMTALSPSLRNYWENSTTPLHLDLLDDWSVHHDFVSIRDRVNEAYRIILGLATSVTANSEGTIALANRFGRTDAVLLPNGCDPEKFSTISQASGDTTVGYIGKIGERLDVDMIRDVCESLPNVKFVFAGPVLGTRVGRELSRIPNIDMLGDVRYPEIPELLSRFDIGWVPHGVEKGQVGGDAIKIYEYRAAGLQVVTTPIIGTRERPMDGVHVASAAEHSAIISSLVGKEGRVARDLSPLPRELTWEYKTGVIVQMLKSGAVENDE